MRKLKEALASSADAIVDIIVAEKRKRVLVVIKESGAAKAIRPSIEKVNTVFKIEYVLSEDLLNKKGLLTYITDGVSLKHNKKPITMLGADEKAIITYSLENLDHIKKTQFGYALKGRKNGEGILRAAGGEALGRNNIILPYEKLPEIRLFFEHWKVSHSYKRIIEVSEK